jgi:hypothetical protein
MAKNRNKKNTSKILTSSNYSVEAEKYLDEKKDGDDDDRVWSVFSTLLFFTAIMFILPIGSYFLSKSYLFEGMLKKQTPV